MKEEWKPVDQSEYVLFRTLEKKGITTYSTISSLTLCCAVDELVEKCNISLGFLLLGSVCNIVFFESDQYFGFTVSVVTES